MSDGGCAGAGPSSGFSGWKRTSGDVTSATPVTRRRSGRTPRRGASAIVSPTRACSVAASCWSSTTPPSRSAPRSILKVWKDRGYPGGTARIEPAPERMSPAAARFSAPANGAVAAGTAAATPGCRATPAATRVAAAPDATGPCQSSGTLRTALPVIVRRA